MTLGTTPSGGTLMTNVGETDGWTLPNARARRYSQIPEQVWP